MEPGKGMIISGVSVSGVDLNPGDCVWILDESRNGYVRIEYRNKEFVVPGPSVVSCPVPAPDLKSLREIDDCFGRGTGCFREVHKSDRHWFRLLRCRRHGALFLEDTRGGVGVYTGTIIIADADEDPETIWRRYHDMPDDWLNYLGIVHWQ